MDPVAPSLPSYGSSLRPGPVFTTPVLTVPMTRPDTINTPLQKPGVMTAPLLPGHESFIECPGRAPIKVTSGQAVSYYWPLWLIRIHYKQMQEHRFY